MSLSLWLVFLPACFALNMAFGPNNLLSVTNGARQGLRPAILAAIGRLPAFAAMIALTAAGLGALLATSEWLFDALKFVGAAYLVYIGIRLLLAPAPFAQAELAPRSVFAMARQEFLVAAGNPKAVLVFTAFFPQFLDPAHYWSDFTIMGVTFLGLEVVAMVLYAMLGRRVGALARDPSRLRWVSRLSGGTMIGFGLALAFARKPG